MGNTWELQLIAAIVESRDLRTPIDRGITDSTFGSVEAKLAYLALSEFYNDNSHYGEVMSRALLLARNPGLELPRPQQSLEVLCREVIRNKLRRDLENLLGQAGDLLDESPERTLHLLSTRPAEMEEQYGRAQDTDFAIGARDNIERRYQLLLQNEMTGRPWPWPQLTNQIGGIEPGDFVVIYGLPKSMKTWIALLIGVVLYQTCQCRVLIYSKEMNRSRLEQRVALLLAGLDYDKFRRGNLDEEELEYLLDMLEFLKMEALDPHTHRRIIFTEGMTKNSLKLEILRRKIDVWRPDIVILDSAYQLSADRNWEKMSRLTEGLKEIAKETNIPVVAVTQENERAAYMFSKSRTASIAHSQSWQMDADTIVHVVLTTRGLSLHTVSRESAGKGIRIHAKPAYDFNYIDTTLESVTDNQEEEKKRPPIDVGATRRSSVRARGATIDDTLPEDYE